MGSFNFENTGGKIHIVLQNGTVGTDGKCNYNLFICAQPAIGATENNMTARLFSVLYGGLKREMGCDDYWPLTMVLHGCGPVTPYGYMPHYYEFNYSAGETGSVKGILAAVDAAFWEWSREHYYDTKITKSWPKPLSNANGVKFSYAPWNLKGVGGSSAGDPTCSNNIMRAGGTYGIYVSQPTLIYYNGDDFSKAKTIRLSIGVAKNYYSIDPYDSGDNKGPECGGSDKTCYPGDTCGSAKDKLCCSTGYSRYFDQDNAKKCWADKVTLMPVVQVCAYS
jgi:hypothetical protein